LFENFSRVSFKYLLKTENLLRATALGWFGHIRNNFLQSFTKNIYKKKRKENHIE
jgi:hypothetical protein